MKVLLQRTYNQLALAPVPKRLRRLLENLLTYTSLERLQGEAAAVAKGGGFSTFQEEERECFDYDAVGRFCFPIGYRGIVEDLLRKNRYRVIYKDLRPHPRPEIFKPDFDAIFSRYDLRWGQEELLAKMASYPRGRFDCPTGFGKSFCIGCASLMWPHARIDVLVPGVELLHQMARELSKMVPGVGVIGGGRQDVGTITCISADSLHLADGNSDVVFVDECHEFGTDRRLAQLARFRCERAYGLSASHDAREDRHDFELHGFLGPILFEVLYEAAAREKVVVPIEVLWVQDPWAPKRGGSMRGPQMNRWCIWDNERRNQLIAKVAKSYHKDDQVLITVRTLEHAVNLKALLPEFEMVYDDKSMDRDRFERWVAAGLLSGSEPNMTLQRRKQLKEDFEHGRLKKAIATTVWNRGVDFRQLAVLIRAEGIASTVANIQVPGRLSRIYRSQDGKEKVRGTLIDFLDEWHPVLREKAKKRQQDYDLKKWRQRPWRKPKRG